MARDWTDIMLQMEQWSRDMDRFMRHLENAHMTVPGMLATRTGTPVWSPAVNIYETTEDVLILAELAGVKPEEIQIKYDSGRVMVWGQRRMLVPGEIQAIHRMECQIGPFAFLVDVPLPVSANEAEATLEAGVLLIRLPKRQVSYSGPIRIYAGQEGREEQHDR